MIILRPDQQVETIASPAAYAAPGTAVDSWDLDP